MNRLVSSCDRLLSTVIIHLTCVSLTAGLACLGWLLVNHMQLQQADIVQRTAECHSLLRHAHDMHRAAGQLQEDTAAIQQALSTLRAKWPDTADETTFLQLVSQLAADHGVSVSDYRPGGVAKHAEFHEIELRLSGSGPYAGLCRWLVGLNELPRVVRLSQLTIVAPTVPGGDCAVDIHLQLMFGLDPATRLVGVTKL